MTLPVIPVAAGGKAQMTMKVVFILGKMKTGGFSFSVYPSKQLPEF